MNKVELLAPAGSFEALQAAVQNGCDAVYLGGMQFGARAFAHNFNEEQMQEAIAYAHCYGVRVFVTVNTLMKEEEMDTCLTYVKHLQAMDVDALILQDLGLFTRIHQVFPDMELHASTQMHIHNPQGIKLLKEMGASRVVLPRETKIEEIQDYQSLQVDLEVFVQGALCVSYSGQCLMSALTLQRSGNRGECAQNCRMQYELEKQTPSGIHRCKAPGNYLLSPKDLNTLAKVPELIKAGIASFKIEGRMKRPEYVAYVVASYRKAMDAYYANTDFKIDTQMEEDMQKLFHRGFTTGHLFHQSGSHLMNAIRPNHMGITIGVISNVTRDKMMIHLQKPLFQGDGIRILKDKEDEGFRVNRIYKNGLLVNHGDIGDTIELDKTSAVEKGNSIVLTSDARQLKTIQESYAKLKRRVEVFAIFHMEIGHYAVLEVMDEEGHHVSIKSEQLVEKALKIPLGKERIEMQLQKTKDTPFTFQHIEYDTDGEGTIPIRELNQLRRDALSLLEKERKKRNGDRRVLQNPFSSPKKQAPYSELFVVIHTIAQYQACKKAKIPYIFVADIDVYEQIKSQQGVYLRQPRVMKEEYESTTLSLIQEAGGLYQNSPVITDTSLNVTNALTAMFLFSRNVEAVCFSLECSLSACVEIAESYHAKTGTYGNFVYPVYGYEELMLSEYCVINAVEQDSDKKNCGLCRGTNQYALIDMKKNRYPITCDKACRMHILNTSPRNCRNEIKLAQQHHITSFLAVFTIEDEVQTSHILQSLSEKMKT